MLDSLHLFLALCFSNKYKPTWELMENVATALPFMQCLVSIILYSLIVSVSCRVCITFMFHTCQCIADNIDSSFLGCDYLHNFDLSHLCFSLVLLAVAYGNEVMIILKV